MPPAPPNRTEYYSYTSANTTDFSELASERAEDEDFRKLWFASKKQLDFADPYTVQQLSRSLLKYDFQLKLQLPNDRLCPPIPVRWNYVRWIQDLIDTTSDDYSEEHDLDRTVRGIDIGTGASCIYPLLACTVRPKWNMLGSDIDTYSLEWAQKNVKANNLENQIRLKLIKPSDSLLSVIDADKDLRVDYVMMNPPFYDSQEDMISTYEKDRPPHAVCTGSENEMIYTAGVHKDDDGHGGDLGFVTRLYNESLQLKERVQWYTAMLGKRSTAEAMVEKFKSQNVGNFAVTNMSAGNKTRRYGIAWSFKDLRPKNDVARHGDLVPHLLPAATQWTVEMPLHSKESAEREIKEKMAMMEDVVWSWSDEDGAGVMVASKNTWSRAARRQRKFGEQEKMEEDHIALAVKIAGEEGSVNVRWLQGSDQVIWVSFCGWLKTAVRPARQAKGRS